MLPLVGLIIYVGMKYHVEEEKKHDLNYYYVGMFISSLSLFLSGLAGLLAIIFYHNLYVLYERRRKQNGFINRKS